MARVIQQQKPTTAAAAETTTHSRTFKNKWKKKYKKQRKLFCLLLDLGLIFCTLFLATSKSFFDCIRTDAHSPTHIHMYIRIYTGVLRAMWDATVQLTDAAQWRLISVHTHTCENVVYCIYSCFLNILKLIANKVF